MNSYQQIHLQNKHLNDLDSDFLYHLGIDNRSTDLEKNFGDIRFVCMGGPQNRMYTLAQYIQSQLAIKGELVDLCAKANRYAVYKVGPVLCASHGIGMPSMSILLHEIIKLLSYAKCKNPILFRIGTSGGIGIPIGTVVITKDAYNGYIKNEHVFPVLGTTVRRQSTFDDDICKELLSCANDRDDFFTIVAGTLSTDDFYEGQARTDGACCTHNEQDKINFLQRIYDHGIRNIEMEATMYSSLTKFLGIKAAEICVTMIDRFKGDQVNQASQPKEDLEQRPMLILVRFIKKMLSANDYLNGNEEL